jgi:hypothetical protein
MDVSEAKRLRLLDENRKLKKLLAESLPEMIYSIIT